SLAPLPILLFPLSLHDALPIYSLGAAIGDTLDHAYWSQSRRMFATLEEAVRLYPDDPMAWYSLAESRFHGGFVVGSTPRQALERSEEHTSELQSRSDLVCRLLL